MSAPDHLDDAAEEATNAWLWHRMDRVRAEQLWHELAEWVQWLRETYQFGQGQFPACWYRHAAVREELTALMAAHKAAYPDDAGADAYRSDMTAWHTHELWPMINRLKAIGGFSDCTNDACRHHTRTVVTVPGLDEFITDDLLGREEPVDEPEPVADEPPHEEATVVECIRVQDMESALAAGLAELVDPGNPYGPVRFEEQVWTYSSTAKGYLPTGPDQQ